MMPQSLMISRDSSSGSSIKRQRSADSREVQTRPMSTGPSRSNGSLSRAQVRIPSYLDKSKAEISTAFQDLEWKQRFRLFHALENPTTSPFRVDRSDVVISRNRYGNVQPWDNSRVKLKTPLSGSDYVNASPIVLQRRALTSKQDDAGQDNDRTDKSAGQVLQQSNYIATQGPKLGQYACFWHMVMQESIGDVGVVVMLTQCYEANREKCAQYFPTETNPTITLPSEPPEPRDEEAPTDSQGDVAKEQEQDTIAASQDTVSLVSTSYDPETGSDVRILKLTINDITKEIHHYLYHGWPDFGRPEAEERIALLNLVRQTKTVAGTSPRIVHCSAGVGRTGTFIALDFLVHEIDEDRILNPTAGSTSVIPSQQDPTKEAEKMLTPTGPPETWGKSGPPKVKTPTTASTTDSPSGEENLVLKDDLIYDVVNTLREQRMMMVMNELQYAFLYEVVKEVFLEKYRARPEGVAVVRGEALGETDPTQAAAADLPRGKVAKVEGLDVQGTDGNNDGIGGDDSGTVSEAETEIMEGDGEEGGSASMKKGSFAPFHVENDEGVTDENKDPYDVVAPEHIRAGIERSQ